MDEGFEFYTRTDVPWTHARPTPEDVERASEEGRVAGTKGHDFIHVCPYTFDKFKRMTYAEFNGTQRPLLDAWFKAWDAARKGAVWRTI